VPHETRIEPPDSKIVVAGSHFTILRYLPDGSLDPSFGTGGVVTTVIGTSDAVGAVLVQPDGRIVAAGHTSGATPGLAQNPHSTLVHHSLVRALRDDARSELEASTGQDFTCARLWEIRYGDVVGIAELGSAEARLERDRHRRRRRGSQPTRRMMRPQPRRATIAAQLGCPIPAPTTTGRSGSPIEGSDLCLAA